MLPEELERRRKQQREYWNRHKDEINKKKRKQYENDPVYKTKSLEYAKKYRDKNREKINERAKIKEDNTPYGKKRRKSNGENYWRRKEETKVMVFHILGDKCVVCGEKESVCFDVHHVNERGKRPSDALSRWKEYLTKIKEGEEMMLLCSNCHRKYHSGLIDL